jgi:hypothetical protein
MTCIAIGGIRWRVFLAASLVGAVYGLLHLPFVAKRREGYKGIVPMRPDAEEYCAATWVYDEY